MRHALQLFVPLLATFALAWDIPAEAASHREAPLIALDPSADNTDVYAFVSYDAANLARAPADRRVTFILNVNPGQDPSDGPNYFNFGDDVLYAVHIDNDKDGKADDVAYEFRFKTENRPVVAAGDLTSPLPYLGNPHIPIITPGLPLGGITALDGPGSEGLTRRQTYTVTEIRHGYRTDLFKGRTLVAVPSNVGPATMPDYPALAAQGIYSDTASGIRVFAGQRAETFYIDLGAVFDTLNLRRYLPALTGPGEDSDNVNPFGVNRFAGFNISTIAIEVPITRVTSDGKPAGTTNNLIGVYANTARQKGRVRGEADPWTDEDGAFVQVSRMANPLVNELIITTPFKDEWNASKPEDEANFQAFYQNPVVATELKLVFGVDVVPTPRTDLMSLLLKYKGQALSGSNCGRPCAELLRLDLSVPPTAPDSPTLSRLGSVLGGDPAGYPNGRRPNDDVTDITVRVVGGTKYINAHIGDGVNFLAGAPGAGTADVTMTGIARNFPFLPTPYDGKCSAGQGSNPCVPKVP